ISLCQASVEPAQKKMTEMNMPFRRPYRYLFVNEKKKKAITANKHTDNMISRADRGGLLCHWKIMPAASASSNLKKGVFFQKSAP
ncbi:MAG TPA: hypothetical protein PK977_11420, partial [Chitinophagaceae bacterium]|nr:hypothetical protein [Chitinophagaceae bacterium]